MQEARDVLRDVMATTGTSQAALSRISGVRQPTISQVLAGKVGVSDAQLERLLASMGFRLEVTRRPVPPDLTPSELRSWRLHRQVAARLSPQKLVEWAPLVARNLTLLRSAVQGEPHERNLDEWADLVDAHDLVGVHRVLTGLDRHSVEMREVSPMRGVLPEVVRRAALAG